MTAPNFRRLLLGGLGLLALALLLGSTRVIRSP